MSKSISQFLPLTGQSREDADRHYRRAHTRFARAQLRTMPHVLTYHTNRAEAEYDIAGGWSQRPRAFRFVILRFAPGRSLDFPPDVRERVAQDHRLFLRELRGFAVEEEVLVDRLSGQTALVKYLFEYERPCGSLPPDFHPVLDALAVTVREQSDAFGLRQVLLNRVRAEPPPIRLMSRASAPRAARCPRQRSTRSSRFTSTTMTGPRSGSPARPCAPPCSIRGGGSRVGTA